MQMSMVRCGSERPGDLPHANLNKSMRMDGSLVWSVPAQNTKSYYMVRFRVYVARPHTSGRLPSIFCMRWGDRQGFFLTQSWALYLSAMWACCPQLFVFNFYSLRNILTWCRVWGCLKNKAWCLQKFGMSGKVAGCYAQVRNLRSNLNWIRRPAIRPPWISNPKCIVVLADVIGTRRCSSMEFKDLKF